MLLLIACPLIAGCQRHVVVEPHVPEGTISRYPAAADLAGRPLDDIAVQAVRTVSDRPLTTQTIRRTAEEAKPAVVAVRSRSRRLLGIAEWRSLGSGFFIHPSGLILTNEHVIKSRDEITVRTHAEEEYDATVVARHEAWDLALLRIEADEPFPVIAMGDSDAVDVGEMAIAIGHPFGLGYTVTFGIISKRPRQSASDDEDDPRKGFLQTDAILHPGSSGGPLITVDGAWVGVNMGGLSDAAGIGFAIPSSRVREFLNSVTSGGQGPANPLR